MIQPILTYAQLNKFYDGVAGDYYAPTMNLWEWTDENYGAMFREGDYGCKSVLHPNRPAANSPLWATLKKHLAAHSPKSRAVLPDFGFYVSIPVEVAMPYGRE
jgi:hypothetical protein